MSFLGKLRGLWAGSGASNRQTVPADPVAQGLAAGLDCMRSGQIEQARTRFGQVLARVPEHAEALHYLGLLAARDGDFAQAAELIARAEAAGPPNAEVSSNLGNALRRLGRPDEALACYDRAIAIDDRYAPAWLNRGHLCLQQKDLAGALSGFDGFLARQPDHAEAWIWRGDVLIAMKRHEEAVRSYDQAIRLAPQSTTALMNRGCTLNTLRRHAQALADFQRVIELEPENHLAHYNLGTVLLKSNASRLEVVQAFDATLRLNPTYGPAYHNRADALDSLGRYQEAIADYQQALKYGSGEVATPGMLMYTRLRICDWQDFEAQRSQILAGIEQGERIAAPFMMLSLSGQLAVQRRIADIVARGMFAANPPVPAIGDHEPHEKIRVAYFSADLRSHPVSYLTAGMFEAHDRERFEIVAFSFGPYDEMTRRINEVVDDFIDARTLSDEDVVQLARTLEIDIAVDLGGYTANNRAQLFAMRLAPIQVGYLGYPGTMGEGMHDYLLADDVLIPHEYEHWYAENIVRLPVYQVNDSKRVIAERVFSRAELGLPETGFVFCCFNNPVKYNPEIFSCWARILLRVPESVLFLLASDDSATANIKREFSARGIADSRIVLGQRLPRPEYLARYRACDLFLDTLPFNAGTTASDALWAGLPVLTCMGEAFASRMAASLLTALKLPELITTTLEDYERLAIELASPGSRLPELRQRLARSLKEELLFDTVSVTRHIESAYTTMMQRYREGLPPASFAVAP